MSESKGRHDLPAGEEGGFYQLSMFYFVSVSLWSWVKHPFNVGRCFACQLHKLSQVSH